MKTFADSTKTPGQHVGDRCYILAQLPEDASLDWACELRVGLDGGELKYERYLSLRHRIQANTALWKRVQAGTAEATIVVIENRFYIHAIAYSLISQGADLEHDVSFNDILKDAVLCMIHHAPIMRLQDLDPELMAGPPIRAHSYTPELIYKSIGSKLNDAAVFAARANAAFDIDLLDIAATTNELCLGPFKHAFVRNSRGMERVFDREHPKSAAMLNDMFVSYDARSNNLQPTWVVSESSSESHDALQAADFCAGFASELMMNATDDREKELRRHFRRVIYNGAVR